jgi:hypothetical protein
MQALGCTGGFAGPSATIRIGHRVVGFFEQIENDVFYLRWRSAGDEGTER